MTLGSLYTNAELRDLLAAKDAEMGSIEKAFHAFDPTWMRDDRNADILWLRDFNALKARYAKARASAVSKLSGDDVMDPLPENLIVADTDYRAVLSALQARSGVTAPTDLQGLWGRLQTAQNASQAKRGLPPKPLVEDPVPQPRGDSDATLNWYKSLDRALPDVPGLKDNARSNARTGSWEIAGAIAAVVAVLFAAFEYKRGGTTVIVTHPDAVPPTKSMRGRSVVVDHPPRTERAPWGAAGPSSAMMRSGPRTVHQTPAGYSAHEPVPPTVDEERVIPRTKRGLGGEAPPKTVRSPSSDFRHQASAKFRSTKPVRG